MSLMILSCNWDFSNYALCFYFTFILLLVLGSLFALQLERNGFLLNMKSIVNMLGLLKVASMISTFTINISYPSTIQFFNSWEMTSVQTIWFFSMLELSNWSQVHSWMQTLLEQLVTFSNLSTVKLKSSRKKLTWRTQTWKLWSFQ